MAIKVSTWGKKNGLKPEEAALSASDMLGKEVKPGDTLSKVNEKKLDAAFDPDTSISSADIKIDPEESDQERPPRKGKEGKRIPKADLLKKNVVVQLREFEVWTPHCDDFPIEDIKAVDESAALTEFRKLHPNSRNHIVKAYSEQFPVDKDFVKANPKRYPPKK